MLTEEEVLAIWAEHGSTMKCLRAIEQATAKRCVDLAREYLTGADVARAIEAEFKPR